ncbi:MAG TPA: hypothetical protein VHT27_08190 [Solirubrobacteraceae bacterium]|nr:hypothetical protein [Solirubrobacteraceae bacterium]
MSAAFLYRGHSIGVLGDVLVVVGVTLRLAWMYRRRRRGRRSDGR